MAESAGEADMWTIDPPDPPLLRVSALIAAAIEGGRAILAARGRWGRILAENSKLRETIALRDVQIKILKRRILTIDPVHRPRYDSEGRFEILRFMRRCRLSIRETARRFVVLPKTVRRWLRDARSREPKLAEPRVPANTLPEFVRIVTHQLKLDQITFGVKRIAETLARLGLQVGLSSVRRILREYPPRLKPKRSKATLEPLGKPIRAKRPNHYWEIDFTEEAPFHFAALIDLYSRKILTLQVWLREPKTRDVLTLLKHAIFTFGRPDYLVTDQGAELTALDFQKFLRRRSIGQRLGAVRSSLSIAVIERFWRSFKEEWVPRLYAFEPFDFSRHRATLYVEWFNRHRPHQGILGRTPNEVYYARRRQTVGRKSGKLRIRYLGGERSLPIYRLAKAA